MDIRRLEKISIFRNSLRVYEKLLEQGFSLGKVLLFVVLVGIVTGVGVNISLNISRARVSYAVLETENQRLLLAKAESAKLEQDLEYYSSLEYRKRYAYDSLNLARDGEEIYIIDGATRDDFSFEQVEVDPVKRNDSKYWWDFTVNLVLGGLRI